MAKDKKEKETKATSVELTVDNVMDEVKKENTIKDPNVQAALDKIQKDIDERQQLEVRNMIMCSKYINTKKLIQLRARRREEKITKESLVKSKEILDKVLAGEITTTQYKDEWQKAKEEEAKAMREADKELSKELNELRNSYTGEYRYRAEWDY